ncbi:MAG: hypothetical protein JWO12_3064 [Frankiales bacterium]|nr:hypothetical protein [Frankiales bacterium]
MQITASVQVDASADRVWGLVSDLPNMGKLSPENTGGTWRKGATGPAVGARFHGSNRSGWRRWSTNVTVVRCAPGEEFAFRVTAGGLGVAEWAYTIVPESTGVTVTETWTDRRGSLMKALGRATTGVADREAHTRASIETTLAALKVAAEA